MSGVRSALIVASYEYEDPGLTRLRAPAQDAEALGGCPGQPRGRRVRDPDRAQRARSHDHPDHGASSSPTVGVDDLLLLHYSGHGVKDETGDLYFAAANTELEYLSATGVSSDFVNRLWVAGGPGAIVLLLDCCYAGAFEREARARGVGSLPSRNSLGGRGRAVITASRRWSTRSRAATSATSTKGPPSVFTCALVQGLSDRTTPTGPGRDVGLDELYEYVYEPVRAVTPNQTPASGRWVCRESCTSPGAASRSPRRRRCPTISRRRWTVRSPRSAPALSASSAGCFVAGMPELSLAARRGLEQLTADDEPLGGGGCLGHPCGVPDPARP